MEHTKFDVLLQPSNFCHTLFQSRNHTIFIHISRCSLCLDEKRNKCAFLTEKTFSNSSPFLVSYGCSRKGNRTLSFRIFEIPSLNFIISFLWIREYPGFTSGNLQPRSFSVKKMGTGGWGGGQEVESGRGPCSENVPC